MLCKVLVCGGRNLNEVQVQKYLEDNFLKDITKMYSEQFDDKRRDTLEFSIIHGGATGADNASGEWAKKHNIPCKVFKADWNRFGKAAGPIRNQEMLNKGQPDFVYAFSGRIGTPDMIKKAKAANVPVFEVDKDKFDEYAWHGDF